MIIRQIIYDAPQEQFFKDVTIKQISRHYEN